MSAPQRMPLADALGILREARTDQVVVTTMGSAREWMTLGSDPLDFIYAPSAMGEAPAVGLGIALAQPGRGVIVGNGDDGPALAARVAASKVGARVHLAGYVKERGPLYGGLDALLHPSHREGLSMVILEAMAAGLPIAATPVGEVGSLLDDGCGAILTDRGPAVTRALTTVISDREFRQELGAQARNRVARTFSSATLSHTYAHELYTPAMARRPL